MENIKTMKTYERTERKVLPKEILSCDDTAIYIL